MNREDLENDAEKIVAETLAELPEDVRDRVACVPIVLEPVPSESDVADGVDPETLGFFEEPIEGAPRIRLWLSNIWDYSDQNVEIFREEVRTTLLHEIGHLLGWNEEDLEWRGLD